MKKKQILKRIREWEKFEANCHMLKELDKEKRKLKKQIRKRHHSAGTGTRSRIGVKDTNVLRKVKSEEGQLSPNYEESPF